MPEPIRAEGFHGKWLSNARMWSAATRELIDSRSAGQRFLTAVAFYLYVHCSWSLISDHQNIPADAVARGDCPPDDRSELQRLDTRLKEVRNVVAHLADMNAKKDRGRSVSVQLTREAPYWSLTCMVQERDTKELVEEVWTRADILGVLDRFDPWLDRQWQRWLRDRREADADSEARSDSTYT